MIIYHSAGRSHFTVAFTMAIEGRPLLQESGSYCKSGAWAILLHRKIPGSGGSLRHGQSLAGNLNPPLRHNLAMVISDVALSCPATTLDWNRLLPVSSITFSDVKMQRQFLQQNNSRAFHHTFSQRLGCITKWPA
jgi:hypothetical protein